MRIVGPVEPEGDPDIDVDGVFERGRIEAALAAVAELDDPVGRFAGVDVVQNRATGCVYLRVDGTEEWVTRGYPPAERGTTAQLETLPEMAAVEVDGG